MRKLIIFDLDGTLVNTVVDLNASLNYAFKVNYFPNRSVEATAKAIGNGIYTTIIRLLPSSATKSDYDKCLLDFRNHYLNHYLDNSLPYEGMLETLKALKESGYYLAVATNKLDEVAKNMVNNLYPNIFDIVRGDNPSTPKKPDPTMINSVIDELNIDKGNVYYVGDSEVDIESASNAGVKLILADYGFHRSEEFVINNKAPHIKEPKDLLKIFR